jgi:hypothetical protein
VQREARKYAEGGQERRGQVPIELDGIEAAAAGQQGFREGAEARADFDQVVVRRGLNGVCDARHDGAIGQEVLAEAFAGLMYGDACDWRGFGRQEAAEDPGNFSPYVTTSGFDAFIGGAEPPAVSKRVIPDRPARPDRPA